MALVYFYTFLAIKLYSKEWVMKKKRGKGHLLKHF